MRREGNVLPPRHCRGKKTWYECEKEGRKRYGRTAVTMKERVGGEWMLAMSEGISKLNRGTDREVRCEGGPWLNRETTSFSFSFPFSFLSTNGCWSCECQRTSFHPIPVPVIFILQKILPLCFSASLVMDILSPLFLGSFSLLFVFGSFLPYFPFFFLFPCFKHHVLMLKTWNMDVRGTLCPPLWFFFFFFFLIFYICF